MEFFKKQKKPKRSGNPYVDGHAEWQEMFGGYVHQAYVWKIVAICCLVITGISVSCNLVQARQFKVVPFYVLMDKLGRVGTVGRADVAIPTPRALIQSELAQFIVNWRTVTADLDLQKRMVDRLANFTTGAAQGYLTEWYASNNPFKTAQDGKLVHVEVKGLPLPVSIDSWRVEWTEIFRNHVGNYLQSATYEATMKIKLTPPETDAKIMANPGGVWVTEISHSKVLGAAALDVQNETSQEAVDQ